MNSHPDTAAESHPASNVDTNRFATLAFEREVEAPLSVLWQAWISPAARAVWSSPSPDVSVEIIEANTSVGGREVSICKSDGEPHIR